MTPPDHLPRTLRDFIVYYWRFDPKRWALFIVQDIIHFSRYPISFVLVGKCVDLLTRSDPAAGIPPQALLYALAIFLILLNGELMHVWTSHIVRKWKPALRIRIRSDFFNYLLGHSHSYFQNNFAGSLARKVTEIAESSVRLHDHVRWPLFGSLTQMVSAGIGLMAISPWYGALVFLFIAIVAAPILLRLKPIGQRVRAFSEVRANVTGTIVDILSNAASMRSFARTPHEMFMHTQDSEREAKADQRRILILIQLEIYRRFCFVALGAGMLLALLYGWRAGMVSIGDIAAVMGLTFSLTGSAWMLSGGIVMTADELGYIEDCIRIVTPPHEVTNRPDASALVMSGGRVTFDRVTFSFGAQPVFRDLMLDIAPGQKIGLLGPSGAGKSTLVNLLLRLYDIQGGAIRVDGQDISAVTQDSLRAQIALMPQDTALFHRTLRDNIRYGCLGATEADIIEAAKKAHAHEFIIGLPDGYDTLVGERGVKLSGGQRQRIAIARAILKAAPILILDEATSALDSESEKMIQDSLKHLMEGRTVIAIAHRLSTIAHLDRLIVMDQGRIIEDGTHAQLMARQGLYARLWGMQSGGFIGLDELS